MDTRPQAARPQGHLLVDQQGDYRYHRRRQIGDPIRLFLGGEQELLAAEEESGLVDGRPRAAEAN